MTALTLSPAAAVDHSRFVLRLDGALTAAVGLLGLLSPLAWYGETPAWVVRGLGVVLVLVGIDLALSARLAPKWLRLSNVVAGELAAAWVVGTVGVLAFVDLPAAGVEVLALVGAVTLGFAVAQLRAARALR